MGNLISKRSFSGQHWILTLLLSLLIVAGFGAPAQAATDPDKLIGELFDGVNKRLKEDQAKIAANPSYLVVIGNEVLGKYISFETMARQILGNNWNDITADQQTRYTKAFRDRIATVVVEQYDPNEEYGLEIIGSRSNSANTRAVVSSIVTDKTTGEKINVAYKMFVSKKSNDWKVYDVVAEGVSVLQSFKSASAEDFRRNGIESMIASLQRDSTIDKVVSDSISVD